MKRLILLAASAALVVAAVADEDTVKIATRDWVTNYVAGAISSSRAELEAAATVTATGGVTVIEAGSGRNAVRLIMQDATDAALLATNCTATAIAQGVTNGCMFVWNGAGAYINPNGTISCTATNLVYSGVSSVHTNGVDRFTGLFDARGVLIQPNTSFAITNGMTEAHQ